MRKKTAHSQVNVLAGPGADVSDDPKDREIARLKAQVSELIERNEVLQEAIRRLQGGSASGETG
jgi:hypothetical protein